jgi:hypothetical protein
MTVGQGRLVAPKSGVMPLPRPPEVQSEEMVLAPP